MDINLLSINERLNQQQEKEFGEKLGAMDDRHAARRAAFGEYMELVGLAASSLNGSAIC